MKAKNLNTKILFKKLANKFLPEEITKRKKQGFAVPLKYWFKGRLDEYAKDILLSHQCLGRGYFNKKTVEDLFVKYETGSRDFGFKIWRLLMLELWFREYQDKSQPSLK